MPKPPPPPAVAVDSSPTWAELLDARWANRKRDPAGYREALAAWVLSGVSQSSPVKPPAGAA